MVFLLLCAGIFQFISVQKIEAYNSDSSVYITLAHNILQKGQYEFDAKPEVRYPPGFPVLLASISGIVHREGYDLYILFMPVFCTLALIVWYRVLSLVFGRGIAAFACIVVASSKYLFEMATQSVLSDAVFFLLSGLALWFLSALDGDTPARSAAYGLSALAAVSTVAALLTRSAGLAICVAEIALVIGSILLRRKLPALMRRTAILSAICGLIVFSAWNRWTKVAESKQADYNVLRTYSGQFKLKDPHRPDLGLASRFDLAQRVTSNIPILLAEIGSICSRIVWIERLWYSPCVVLLLILLTAGVSFCILEGNGALLAWYFAAYFCIYLLWPFDEGPRFMLPVAPLAFALAFSGFQGLRRLADRRYRSMMTAMALLSAICLVSAILLSNGGRGSKINTGIWIISFVSFLALSLWPREKWPGLQAIPLRPLVAFCTAIVAGLGVHEQTALAKQNINPDPTTFRHFPAADFAHWLSRAPAGAAMAQQSEIIHRLTGRLVEKFLVSGNAQEIVSAAETQNVRYIMISDPVRREYFFPTEEERLANIERYDPELLRFVHAGPGYQVFEFATWNVEKKNYQVRLQVEQ